MDKKNFIILVSIFIIFNASILSVFLFTKNEPALNPEKVGLTECKILKNVGGNLNFVFFSSKSQAKEYSEYFIKTPPFNENPEEFNFYYIDTYEPECEIYKGKAVLCRNKDLIEKASSCPSDFIVVIKKEKSSIRSSAYMNIISLNSEHSLTVILHEFGHIFAMLADEYVPATLPKGAKNCVTNCEQFNVKNDCYEGCSKQELYRSVANGVMRSLSSENYGVFNEKLITERIKSKKNSITGKAVTENGDCLNKEYYLIQGYYENGDIQITDKTLEVGCSGGENAGNFAYRIILDDKSIFEEFNPELIFTDSEENGEVYENEGIFFLKIPVIEGADKLEIMKEGEIIEEVDLKELSKQLNAKPCKK